MLVYCGKDWEHVGRGLAADDASLVWTCLWGGVWVVTREKGWPLMLTMLVYCGKDWEHVGRGLGADAHDASLVWACLGVGVCGGACGWLREKGWPLMLTMLVCCGKDWEHVGRVLAADAHDASLVWACLGVGVWGGGRGGGGGVWVVTREKGWPLMLTMLGGKDWEHVGRGLAADAHDASLVWACLGVGVCGGGVWVVTRERFTVGRFG